MNPFVESAVKAYMAKATHPGKKIGSAKIKELQTKLTVPLPEWYAQLLLNFPLPGMYLDFPVQEAKGDDDGFETLALARPQDIYNETEEAYPGLAIREMGYACFATDPSGGGNPYFIKVREGDNPPVYRVYHDVSEIGTEIEKDGMLKISDTLSEFFTRARVCDYKNPFEEKE